MKIIIAGGSGFLGQALREFFQARGDEVLNISRREEAGQLVWDSRTLGKWADAIDGSDVLINLAGRSVDCRYNEKNRTVIMNSRVESTRVLGEAVAACSQPPRVWINSSTATIYPHTTGEAPANIETSATGSDFSMDVATAWEAEFARHARPGVRQVAPRTSIVLGNGGGAFIPLRNLCKLWMGGHQGDGSQWVTWLHVDDFVRQVAFLIERDDIEGPVNCTAPEPVSNRAFMAALREGCGRSWGLPQPAWLLRFGAIFLRTQAELILKSRKVAPGKLRDAGFEWTWPELSSAVKNLAS